ncbi:MAG: hypothetical protein R3300_21070 [Candidatus Promineifilaceae bacterium]|nr:hypothetical protein [Candidatus Promineifilaceae bacterium]
MSARLDWQADEERDWPEAVEQQWDSERGRPTSRRRPVVWILIGLVALLAVGGLVWLSVNRQAEAALDTAVQDVASVHALMLSASAARDVDLFETLLSRSAGPTWRRLQLALAREGLRDQLPALGLYRADIEPGREVVSIEVTPDLTTALVSYRLAYNLPEQSSAGQSVWLGHEARYQREGQRWKLVPLAEEDDYWGDWRRVSRGELAVIVPERDGEIARRLTVSLAQLLDRVCSQAELACPEDLGLTIRLERNVRSLQIVNDSFRRASLGYVEDGYFLSLPTPSLVGVPMDDAGYQALRRGYSSWVVALLIQRFGQTGLVDSEQRLADFLANYDLALPGLPLVSAPELARGPEEAPPVAWPNQDLAVLCYDGEQTQLLRYRPEVNDWIDVIRQDQRPALAEALSTGFPVGLTAAPDGEGLLVHVGRRNGALVEHRTLLLSGNREQMLLTEPFELQALAAGRQHLHDPQSRRLVVERYTSVDGEIHLDPAWFDYDACLQGECKLQLPGDYPFWSPDGSHMLIAAVAPHREAAIILADGEGATIREVGEGFAPNWVDSNRFVYLRSMEGRAAGGDAAGTELVERRLREEAGQEKVILTSADLRQAMPAERRSGELAIMAVTVPRDGPDRWFVAATRTALSRANSSYLFSYDPVTAEVAFLVALDGQRLVEASVAAGQGRYLSQLSLHESVNTYSLSLTVVTLSETGAVERVRSYRTFSRAYGWSADGEWLFVYERGAYRLLAPGYGYRRVVAHDLRQCRSAAWVPQTD